MPHKNCVFCNNDFEKFSLESYEYWDLQLFRDDQYYIGRTVIVLQERHTEDLADLTVPEREELFDVVIPDVQSALEKTFQPDNYNYTSLGDDCSHLHIHVIPRYQHSVEFNGQTFTDEYWNQTHSEKEESTRLGPEALTDLLFYLSDNLPQNN